jgi:hypothetical protein
MGETDVLLTQYPQLFEMYEGLRRFGGSVPMVPEFGFYVGALTLVGAMGLFFLIRRK